jgi:hypothetical protein
MDRYILDEIPFQLDIETLMKRVHVKEEGPFARDFVRLVGEGQEIGRPKALYRLAYIDTRDGDTVTIDGVAFTSRVLRVNLEQAHRVFAYVATCGREIQQWTLSQSDLLSRYWAEALEESALGCAIQALNAHITAHHLPGPSSTMAPGRLGDWPLSEQRALFALLGDTQADIGVELMGSLLMVPTKSVSGMRFPTEQSFESCQLCPRETCPGRRAPYDDSLYARRYAGHGSPLAEPNEPT